MKEQARAVVLFIAATLLFSNLATARLLQATTQEEWQGATDVKEVLDRWAASFRNKDAKANASVYAPVIDAFYERHSISREQHQKEMEPTFAGIQEVKKFAISNIRIALNPPETRAVVRLDMTWDTTVNGQPNAGTRSVTLNLAKLGGWLITREEDGCPIRCYDDDEAASYCKKSPDSNVSFYYHPGYEARSEWCPSWLYGVKPPKYGLTAEDSQRFFELVQGREQANKDNLRKIRAAAFRTLQGSIDRLGIRLGQSQATVKAALLNHGFAMPWTCKGSSSPGPFPGTGAWYSSCATRRGQEEIVAVFQVYSRNRHVQPDTQVATIIQTSTDQLFSLSYQPANSECSLTLAYDYDLKITRELSDACNKENNGIK